MALRIGSATPSKIYRGTTPVLRVYRGTTVVWPYPASGSWGPLTVGTTNTTYSSHTFLEAGSYTLTHTAYGANSNLRVRINYSGGYELGSSYSNGQVSVSLTRTFAVGDVVDFAAFHTSGSSTANGEWTITKN